MHQSIAHEISALKLPTIEIPGLFMDEKLVVKAVSPKVGYSYASMATSEPVAVAGSGGVVKPLTPKMTPPGLAKPTVWKRDSKLVSPIDFDDYCSNAVISPRVSRRV